MVTLGACIRAAMLACQGRAFTIDVLVNGNRLLAEEAAEFVSNLPGVARSDAVRLWFVPLGDKAHTWNEYVHQIGPRNATTFFVDGYAEVRPDAFALIDEGIMNSPDALGATGVPTCGRSAKSLREEMINDGGIHGNMYALSADAMNEIQKTGFRLPLGLYRTDPLIGAVLMFRFAPSKFSWDRSRILVHPQATWFVKQDSIWSSGKLIGQFKRRMRQAQGRLENRAVREHLSIGRRAPETIERTINGLINQWIAAQPAQAARLFWVHPLTYLAAHKMKQEKDWSGAEAPAQLLAVSNSNLAVQEDARLAG